MDGRLLGNVHAILDRSSLGDGLLGIWGVFEEVGLCSWLQAIDRAFASLFATTFATTQSWEELRFVS